MASPLLDLPRELRDMIADSVVVDDQPFRITAKADLTTKSKSGFNSACRQIHAEYASLLRKAAFTPGTTTVAPVYNFDFREMTTFARKLSATERSAAKRNRNLIVNLVISGMRQIDLSSVIEWTRLCETIDLEVRYVTQWTAFEKAKMEGMESAIGESREGKKILRALSSKSVKYWSWEAYQAGLISQK